jgi:SsrA-binding protein
MEYIKNNKKARHDHNIIAEYTAGIMLVGSEVKSVRLKHISMENSYCYISNGEIFIKNVFIEQYEQSFIKHDIKRDKKLLLNKSEIKKIAKELINKSYTVIPLDMYITDSGFVKLSIAVCTSKKKYEKRESLKLKDTKRNIAKIFK